MDYTEGDRAQDIADYVATLRPAVEARRPGDIDIQMMIDRWGYSETTVRRYLMDLVKEGKLTGPHRVQSSVGRAVVWRLVEDASIEETKKETAA